jgi:pyruvate dehydrogenase E1 component alpha subunit
MLRKATGSTKGKGGSMHYYKKSTIFYEGNGIVGAQISVGAGLAFALKSEGKKNCAAIMFSDRAANQGQLY